MTADSPIPTPDLAEFILREWTQAPDVVAAFLGGSVAKGKARVGSDIDAVVIHRHLPQARRETLERAGILVELFFHDRETLAWFWEDDRRRGVPSLARMVAQGLPVAGHPAEIEAIQADAKALLDGGPPPLNAADMLGRRYLVTDLAADLEGDRTPAQRLALGARLYTELADFTVRAAGAWSGSGKGLAKALARHDLALAACFEQAFTMLYVDGNCEAVRELVDVCLAPYGGRFAAGDHRPAPPEWRLSGQTARRMAEPVDGSAP